MKARTAELVSIRISDVKPLDARFVQIVSEYLDGIHTWITTNPDTHHIRLLAARPPRISNAEIQVIRAAFPCSHVNQTPLPRWVRESVLLRERELVELEIVARGALAVQETNPTPIRPAGKRSRRLPH